VCLLDYRHYNFFNLSARGSVDWFVDQCGVLSAGMGVVVATEEVDISGGSTGMRGGANRVVMELVDLLMRLMEPELIFPRHKPENDI